ncbi:MAG: relaxase/mobilization nuclease domain-containing protein, partial [Oscillospiraceae bacterium]|nr:relaxase/mobilization nuclease domain-containing protein [Oscillospiraceae bacterium]
HCIFSAVTIDGTRKFRDFKRSDRVLAKISDHLCAENGLSIVENPQRGMSYNKWLGANKPLGVREQLQFAIDSVVTRCKTWDEFLAEIKTLGFEIKRGAHIAFKLPEGKSFVRLQSLPDGYDEFSIKARIFGEKSFTPKPRAIAPAKVPQLLIDIQAKLQQGYGPGYEHWATLENLKRSAKTLIYIQEQKIDSYEELELKCKDACGEMMSVNDKIKTIEAEQKRINDLQAYIGTYSKTRTVYEKYNAIKNPREKQKYYEVNRDNIDRHRAAKKFFNKQNYKGKLPSINQLKEQWAELEQEKRSLYSEYKQKKKSFTDLCNAKSNAYKMLDLDKRRVTSRGYGVER